VGRAGDIIDAPMLGQKIRFETTGAETDGEVTICHHFVQPKPHSIGPPLHIHKHQAEHYTVLEGSFGVRSSGVDHVLGPGEKIIVPAGIPHLWWNDGPDVAHVILEFRPAGTIDQFFETLFGLSRDGKVFVEEGEGEPKARPKSIVQAVALSYEHGIGLMDVSATLQRFVFPLLTYFGRLRGIRGSYAKYRGAPEGSASAG
jgi:mannose-6-phosphate isomerase-like protein (cupin superfamily)